MGETLNFENIDEYIEYLKGLPTIVVLQQDIHYSIAKMKGWDTAPLEKFMEASAIDAEYARAKQLKDEAVKIIEGLKDKTDPEEIKEGIKRIGELPLLISPIELKPCVWEDYMGDINKYNPEKEFCPKLFNYEETKLTFPPQTLSIIGARTKRGKTIMLVNLVLEAIESEKKCVFISLEMTKRQLLNRLILLRTYSDAVKGNNDTKLESLKKIETEPSTKLYKFFKNKTKEEKDILNLMFKEAADFIKGKMDNGEFELIEAFLSGQEPIIRKVREVEKGTLVLIDYIQRMPEKEGQDYDGGYMRIAKINKELINATFKSEAITICAAQFNRMGGTDDDGSDLFDDTSFKESGSIEQDAHNAIGIGYEGNKKDRFCEILKAREGAGTGKQFSLEFNGAYSYMRNKGYRNKKGKECNDNKDSGGKGKQGKKLPKPLNDYDMAETFK
jgi:hypothetical protein